MPLFTKKFYYEDDEGNNQKFVAYTNDELRERYAQNPSLFFEVPESHAQQVLRQQPAYQEVDDGVVAERLEATRLVRGAAERVVPGVDPVRTSDTEAAAAADGDGVPASADAGEGAGGEAANEASGYASEGASDADVHRVPARSKARSRGNNKPTKRTQRR